MKKLLAVLFVFSISTLVSGAMMLDGPSHFMWGEEFQVVVSGLASDAEGLGIVGGVFVKPGTGGVETTGAVVLPGSGNLGSAGRYDDGYWDGWDFTVGALLPQLPEEEVVDGDWIVLSYIIADWEFFPITFGLYDYSVSYDEPIQEIVVIVPEPVSVALLGFGFLLVRRRA